MALPLLHVGEKAIINCPSQIAYGQRGSRTIPPASILQFEVQVVASNSQARLNAKAANTSSFKLASDIEREKKIAALQK